MSKAETVGCLRNWADICSIHFPQGLTASTSLDIVKLIGTLSAKWPIKPIRTESSFSLAPQRSSNQWRAGRWSSGHPRYHDQHWKATQPRYPIHTVQPAVSSGSWERKAWMLRPSIRHTTPMNTYMPGANHFKPTTAPYRDRVSCAQWLWFSVLNQTNQCRGRIAVRLELNSWLTYLRSANPLVADD